MTSNTTFTSTEDRKLVIQNNINLVREKLLSFPQKIRLVNVSKTKPITDIQYAYEVGERVFGESYVQELIEKTQKLPSDIEWHFIGSIQSNKLKMLATISNLTIETLSSLKHASQLQKLRSELDLPPIDVFLQVNTSGEDAKSGLPNDIKKISELIQYILKECPKLQLKGLMTIGSISESSNEDINADFKTLVNLKNQLETELELSKPLELSMGMSMDFVLAARMGSTNVRVGSTIFGARQYRK